MNVLGIIAEYNPFHNGHKYHLAESKKQTDSDISVAVMSGNFVQRGEPAMLDKWKRAEMAVKNGVDLVFELPFVYACNNAEYFAKGAVGLLNRLNVITHLSFGSECGDIAAITELAGVLTTETGQWKEVLQNKLKEGISYPKARYEATSEIAGENLAGLLLQPNNILAVEYIKQMIIFNSKIIPNTFARYGSGYYEKDETNKIAGATLIRDMIYADELKEAVAYVPNETRDMLESEEFMISEQFFDIIAAMVLIKDAKNIAEIFSATEGLENRVKTAMETAEDLTGLINETKSKRYTETRIKRFLFHILFDLTKNKMCNITDSDMMYGRVLAFNENGASLLRRIKKEGNSIPVITNINKERDAIREIKPLVDFDILAGDLYNLIKWGETYTHSDYRMVPYMKMVENGTETM